jgi:flagellin
MRIQHNIMAMNAYRNYNNNTSALSSNLEKLSSGYKINRAGDDAAGLAISEKMRAQISGLEQASSNVKDGISLVKTGEGAMQEVQDMLNRMVTLATQSANGTYDNETDRANLQKEVVALKDEINRIADSANFNGINLLDGSLEQKTAVTAATDVSVTQVQDGTMAAEGQAGEYTLDLSNLKITSTASKTGSAKLSFAGVSKSVAATTKGGSVDVADLLDKWSAEAGSSVSFGGSKFDVTVNKTAGTIKLKMQDIPSADWNQAITATITATSGTSNYADQVGVTTNKEAIAAGARVYAQGTFTLANISDGTTLTIGEDTYTFAVGADSKYKDGANVVDLTDMKASEVANKLKTVASRLTTVAADNKLFKVGSDTQTGVIKLTEKAGLTNYETYDLAGTSNATDATWKNLSTGKSIVQQGKVDNSKTTGGLKLQIGDTAASYNQLTVSISDIHTDSLGIDGIDISSQEGAQAAIDKIKAAINQVSSTRGDLGAVQNRLEHTSNNLSVMTENIQDAESTIRDTDVAEEMMSYTKNNILVQSAQAMLAQANSVPQGVLQLLQ